MRQKEKTKSILSKLINDSDFMCYREDKWLQNSTFEEKIKTLFGSVEKAQEDFKNDLIFNSKNY